MTGENRVIDLETCQVTCVKLDFKLDFKFLKHKQISGDVKIEF